MGTKYPNDGNKVRFHLGVGRAIRRAREDAGWTMVKLGEALGMACHTTLANIESGRTPCPLYTLARIAHHLDVTLDELVPVDVEVEVDA